MSVVQTMVKAGELTIDGKSYKCQPTTVSIKPSTTSGGGSANTLEVLCGDVLTDGGGGGSALAATLEIVAIQDFGDAAGLIAMSWKDNGKTVPFTWQPTNSPADAWSGMVTVTCLEVGGKVGERIDTSASWTITKLNLPPKMGGTSVIPAAATVDKGVAAPGTVYPGEATVTAADATNAAKLTGLGYVAVPTTAWTTGQKITIGAYDFSWDGSKWNSGAHA